ncbi:MAG: hypothetical protein AB1648_04200 [Pseudomonadota bacterium]
MPRSPIWVGDELSVIDLKTDQKVAREPNGVSLWNRQTEGTL